MKIYKVYDDEWQEIKGDTQLKEFAIMQTVEKINTCDDDEINEDINMYIDDNYKDEIRQIIKLFPDTRKVLNRLSNELAIEILKLRYFYVEEIEVY